MSVHRGMIEFDKLVVIVIALAVLLFVVILFKTGFGSVGGSVGQVSKSATGQTDKTSGTISGALGSILGCWGDSSKCTGGTGTGTSGGTTTGGTTLMITPGKCDKSSTSTKTGCTDRGGVCATAKVCENSGGYWNTVWTCTPSTDSTGATIGCCCEN